MTLVPSADESIRDAHVPEYVLLNEYAPEHVHLVGPLHELLVGYPL